MRRGLSGDVEGVRSADELLRGFGEDAAHGDVAVLQAADEIERLVARDAAADDEDDAAARFMRISRAWRWLRMHGCRR